VLKERFILLAFILLQEVFAASCSRGQVLVYVTHEDSNTVIVDDFAERRRRKGGGRSDCQAEDHRQRRGA